MRQVNSGFDYSAVDGLTLGADPIATAMMNNASGDGSLLNSFVVPKSEKQQGLQRRIEGPEVSGVRVLAVEDTSTTGSAVLTAVDALLVKGAVVAGASVIVDRGARAGVEKRGYEYTVAYSLADLGLE